MLHGYHIHFVLGYCIAAAPDPAGVQIAELQLNLYIGEVA